MTQNIIFYRESSLKKGIKYIFKDIIIEGRYNPICDLCRCYARNDCTGTKHIIKDVSNYVTKARHNLCEDCAGILFNDQNICQHDVFFCGVRHYYNTCLKSDILFKYEQGKCIICNDLSLKTPTKNLYETFIAIDGVVYKIHSDCYAI